MHLVPRFIIVCTLHAVACAAEADPTTPPAPPYSADYAPVLSGAPDHGRDPSIVALVTEDSECSGVLVAPDILLTSRHCVASKEAPRIDVWNGEDLDHAELAAHGWRIVIPPDCDADAAMMLLDRDIPGIHTSSFRIHGPTDGEHLRAIGFVRRDGPLARLFRDHADVSGTLQDSFMLDELPCMGSGGHVAVDEDTGEIVGVRSNLAPCGDGNRPIYVRTDALLGFVHGVLALSGEAARVQKAAAKDAGAPDAASTRRLPKSSPPAKDFGAACAKGIDCAAGVCVTDRTGHYCSRTCDTNDRCPNGYRCVAMGTRKACLRTGT